MTPEACAEILPHPTTVSRQLLDLANNLVPQLGQLLHPQFLNVGGAISLDIWSDDFKKQSYMGVIVHFLDEKFALHDRILATHHIPADLKKTGKNLKTEIYKILRKFKIFEAFSKTPKRVVFTTDRGSNIICGLKDNERLNCFAHLLNNLVGAACKVIDGHGGILESCKSVVSYIKRLGLNTQFKNGALKMSCETRWNSNYDMLLSVLKNWDEVVDLLEKQNASEKLMDLDHVTIRLLVDFLQPFKIATTEVEASLRPTLYLVQLWSQIISQHLTDKPTDDHLISEMKEAGRNYYLHIDQSITMYHKYAVFMHPLFKSLKSFSSMETDEIISNVCYIYVSKIFFRNENFIS